MLEFTKEDVLLIVSASKQLGSNIDNYEVNQIVRVCLFPQIENKPSPVLPVKHDTVKVFFKKVATAHGFEWQFYSLQKPN